jgi:thiamine biosynthesis lipoprotein
VAAESAIKPQRLITRAKTRVMSCSASVIVTVEPDGIDGEELARQMIRRLGQLELRWSRFLPNSEVTGLNAADGAPRRVSTDTLTLVEALVQAWHATDGAFDPTLLSTLVELGYAASRTDGSPAAPLGVSPAPRGNPGGILIDRTANVVQLPSGTTIDPGGLGKGLAADLVTAEAMEAGALGALVEIGGDVRVVGVSPEGEGWPISLTAIDSDVPAGIVDIRDGGIATSTPRLRTWATAGEQRHHLIDPTTLRPSTADVVSCTVIAGTAAWAEAHTKIFFSSDLDDALAHLDRIGLAASVTTSAGTINTSLWKEFCR